MGSALEAKGSPTFHTGLSSLATAWLTLNSGWVQVEHQLPMMEKSPRLISDQMAGVVEEVAQKSLSQEDLQYTHCCRATCKDQIVPAQSQASLYFLFLEPPPSCVSWHHFGGCNMMSSDPCSFRSLNPYPGELAAALIPREICWNWIGNESVWEEGFGPLEFFCMQPRGGSEWAPGIGKGWKVVLIALLPSATLDSREGGKIAQRHSQILPWTAGLVRCPHHMFAEQPVLIFVISYCGSTNRISVYWKYPEFLLYENVNLS